MIELDADGDAVTNLQERRWFAAAAAARATQSECDMLREVMQLAESSWRAARTRLARLEAVRDSLSEELAHADTLAARHVPHGVPVPISSAA